MTTHNSSSGDQLDLLPVLRIGWKYKWVLLAVLLVAATLSYLMVKSIAPLYESHAILYPSGSNSRDKQLQEFSFGYEVHSERLVQLLNSQHITDSLIFQYDLANRYEVNMAASDGYDRLLSKTRSRVQFHKTRYSSVVISVQDESPEVAADMANEAARLVNVVNALIIKENAGTALEAAEREFKRRSKAMTASNDSIEVVKEFSRSESVSMIKNRIRNRENRINGLRQTLDKIRQEQKVFDYGFQVNILNEQLADAKASFLQAKGKLAVLEPHYAEGDTMILNIKAVMSGAQMRMDQFQTQLNNLSSVNAEYNTAQSQLDEEEALLLESKKNLEDLSTSLDPEINSRNLTTLESNYDWEQIQLRELERNYQRALSDYLDPVPIAYKISNAKPSYRKVFPNVKVSVLLAGFGAFFFAWILLTLIERTRRKRS